MIVMILAAYLKKAGRTDQMRWVWIGVATALAATITAFAIIYYGTKTLTTIGQEIVGGIGSLIAVAIVSYILLWMRGASKDMKGELEGHMTQAIAVAPPPCSSSRSWRSFARALRLRCSSSTRSRMAPR